MAGRPLVPEVIQQWIGGAVWSGCRYVESMTGIETASNGDDRMSRRQIALMLTLSYWVTAALVAGFTPRDDWIDLRWPIAIYFFAIPVTILLWMIVIGVHRLKLALSRSRFTLIGIALPVVYVAVVGGGGRWLSEQHEQRLEDQLRASVLATFDDEPLVGPKGPIGVRLRYGVVYPRGLDLDEDHGAFAQLRTGLSHSTFVMIRRVVKAHVSGRFRAGTYEITEDFVPAFLPPSLLYATSEPAVSDHCFRWLPDMSRQELLAKNSEPMVVAICLAHSPIQRSTQHLYRLGDFYATAVLEGAVDCAS
jgi:hypothetical protein